MMQFESILKIFQVRIVINLINGFIKIVNFTSPDSATKNALLNEEVFMFKKLMLVAMLVTSGFSTQAMAFKGEVECSNEHMTFQLVHEGNPRNGASSKIISIMGEAPFGNPWLWKLESDSGFFVQQQKYRTMMGGTLTIAKQLFIGRGGCTRAGCDDHLGSSLIYASYVNQSGNEFNYACEAL